MLDLAKRDLNSISLHKIGARAGVLLGMLLLIAPLSLEALPPTLSAISDDFQALQYNPAALTQKRAAGVAAAINYGTQFPDSLSADLFLNGDNVAYQLHLGSPVRQRLGVGLPLGDFFAVGAALELEELNFSALDIAGSLLVRPWRYISLGTQVTLESLRNPEIEFSLGLRPFTERVTIGVGSRYANGQVALPTIVAQIEPVDGIRIDGGFDIQDSSWHIALSVAFSNIRTGSEVRVDNGSSFAGGGLWSHIATRNFPSIIDNPPGRFIEYSVGEIVDQRNFAPTSLLAGFDPRQELVEVLQEIEGICNDPWVRGVVFRKENIITNLANFEELRQAFSRCKSQQKPIIFYHTTYGNVNYAFAAAIADHIFLHPTGAVGLRGLASIRPYLKELLDNIGVEVTAYRSHPTKSFGSIYTASEMGEGERQQIARLFSDYYQLIEEMIDQRKSQLTVETRVAIDDGPYLRAERAREVGLVDGLLYEDEFDAFLKENYDYSVLRSFRRAPTIPRQWPDASERQVALIYASGAIVNGQSIRGRQIGDDSIIAAIERASNDGAMAAILLRINSGGGAALASESIARALSEAAQRKPVIVWMGSVAASGGYYIAAPANVIIASPVSLSGSIGVVALAPTIVGLSDTLGIEWDGVRGSPSADFAHPGRAATAVEQERLQALINRLYQRFVEQVAEYRNAEEVQIDAVAQGLIWSGRAAQQRGLVDTLGGYPEVLEELQRQVGSQHLRLVPFEHSEWGLLRDIGYLVTSYFEPELPPELEALLRGEIEALFITPWYPPLLK